MKKVSVGVFYQAYGRITVEVPDEVSENDIREYLEEHRDEYPLPSAPRMSKTRTKSTLVASSLSMSKNDFVRRMAQ